ncbi:MAG: hypothetical protein HKN79_03855 [Flavobacteriales bacterium]|nr:hypothetical protein [Flavobacteriales bacterium]
MNRAFTFLLICVIHAGSIAQGTGLLVNDNTDRWIWNQRFDVNDDQFHSVYRSYDRNASGEDSTHNSLRDRLKPVFLLGGELGIDPGHTPMWTSQALVGLAIDQPIGKRIRLQGAAYGGIVDGTSLLYKGPVREDVYPGIGKVIDEQGGTASIWNGLFALRFDPSHIFSIELGRAKHFWGDGYRSLFLSDHAPAYPYLQLKTKVWHIDYTNLFSWQQGIIDIDDEGAAFEDKFTSTHMLSWNISPRINVQIFETIIWQSEDSLSQRGFDVQYLNPIIFYRPVEFASGSADNAIIGLGMSFKVYPSYLIYAQFAFDEFLLDQFQAANGWWGNKFGIQLGVKGQDVLGVEGLYMQSEFNMVRPFTYSHGSPIQNYAHFNGSLAHPLGANFYEFLVLAEMEKDPWSLRNLLTYVIKGDDVGDINLGGDIFRSYVDPFRDVGNFIGQGDRTEAIQNSIYLSRILDHKSDRRIMLGYHSRWDMGDVKGTDHIFTLSLRSNIGDGYR